MSAQTALVLVGVFVAAVAVGRLSRRWRRRERMFTGRVRRDVFRRWGPRCAYRWVMRSRCGGGLHVDHQRAYSRGGTTSAGNGQPLCERHNTSKGAVSNWRYVLINAWPVVGHVVYIVRHRRAEGDRS